MADARPYRGVRYVSERAGPLENLVAPPFDVISPDDQKMYYARSPYNVIRLILGHAYPDDGPNNNRYTRARDFFQAWLAAGALHEETQPAYYVYRHHFALPAEEASFRLGLVAAVRLAPFGQGIFPHERTLPLPKGDRLALIQATGVDLSPLFALYEDPRQSVRALLDQGVRAEAPAVTVHSDAGERHELWVLQDAAWARRLHTTLTPLPLTIADGHHRYETALAYQGQQRQAHPAASPDAAFHFVMMLLVDARDPGLRILPTHRVVRAAPGYDARAFRHALAERFTVTPMPQLGVEEALRRSEAPGHRFGICLGADDFAFLEIPASEPPGDAGTGAGLDVAILHRRVLQPLLGIRAAEEESERLISYVRDSAAAIREVVAARAQVAFFLRPPSVGAVLAVARAGALMPHKSTHFFPKPLSGLVFHRLLPGRAVAASL